MDNFSGPCLSLNEAYSPHQIVDLFLVAQAEAIGLGRETRSKCCSVGNWCFAVAEIVSGGPQTASVPQPPRTYRHSTS